MDGISNQEDIIKEIIKCKNSPYYFATKYLTINYKGDIKPFTTLLTEEEFNEMFNKLEKGEYKLDYKRRVSNQIKGE